MNGEATTTVLVLSNLNVTCEVATRGQRLLDVLNDGNTRFLQIHNGKVGGDCSRAAITDVAESLVVKDNLELALLVGTGGSGPRSLFYATLERRTAKVVITVPHALVEGEIHVKGARDAQSFLSMEAGNFVPVTDANVHYLSSDSERIENAVAFVNRAYISSLAFVG